MENQSKKLSIADLKQMKALDVPEDERVKARFISVYNKMHHSEEGEFFYEKEKYNLLRIIQGNKDLMQCTGFSMYGVFLDVAAMGLTLEQTSQPLLYLMFYNQNADTRQNAQWEKRAVLEVSPYGELAVRIKAGQILHADRPVVVYEGDEFQPMVNEQGQKVVKYATKIPRQSKSIIGSFIRLTRPDGTTDFYWMLPEDIERLKGYSEKKNKKTGANSLYTANGGQIDPGFLEAKTIKHAFKTFPKIELGQFSQLQKSEEEIQPMDYGLDEPVAQTQTPEPEPFGPTEDEEEPAGVAVEDNDEIF